MSRQLVFTALGLVAIAAIVVVVILLLPDGESARLEPQHPPAAQTEPTIQEEGGKSARADRTPPSAPVEQTARTAPPSAEPTRQAFADWVLICPAEGSGPGCIIAQNHVQPETQRSVFAIQLRPSDNDGVDALLLTPLNVRLPPGVAFVIGEEDRVSFTFRQCRQELCQADGQLQRDSVFSLLTAPDAQAIFELASGQTTTVTISLNGFSEAFAALKQKSLN